jgi:hypothetical protein
MMSEKEKDSGFTKFGELYDFANSGSVTLNNNGKIIEVNSDAAKIIGSETKNLLDRDFADFITRENKPVFTQFLEKIFSSKTNNLSEITLISPGNIPVFLLLSGIITENPNQCVVSMTDISLLKQSQEQFRNNNSRLELAMQASNMAWWEMDMTNGNVVFEKRKAEMLGYSPDNFKHYNDFTALVHPDDFEDTMNAMRAHIEGRKEKYETEYRILTKSEGYKWFYDTGSIVKRDENGTPLYITGLVIDISDRKESEERLRSSEIRYRRLFESAKDGILILDAETGMIIDVNPFLLQLLGFSEEQLLQKAVWEIGFFKDIAANHEKFLELQQKKYVRYENLPLETIDGRKIHIEFVSNVYVEDQIKVIQCNIRDISERVLAEAQKKLVFNELEDSRQQLLSLVEDNKLAETEVRNSEKLLHTLFQTIPDLIWLKDTEGVYLSCNEMFGRFFGAKEAEIKGKTDYDFVDKELADFFRENDRIAMSAGMPTSNEEWVTFADRGNQVYLDTIKTPMIDANGNLIGVLGIGHDITKRKKTEEALIESETKYRSFFENSMDAILLTIPEGITVSANPAACRMFGYTEEELIKLGRNGVVDIADPNLEFMIAERALKGTVQCELTFLRKGGIRFPAEISSSLFKNYKGQLRNSMIIRDITERKNIEEKLRASEERMRITLEETQIGNFDWDLKNDIFHVSPTYYTMLGYAPKEGPADREEWLYRIHPDDKDIPTSRINSIIEGIEHDYQYDARIKHADGSYRWISASGHVINRDENNKPTRMIGVRIDTTERKQAEKELIEAKERAEESDRLKSAFLANMSHEIRTPMNGIMGFTELLKQPMLTGEQQQDYISIIETSGIRMLNIINDIISISKIESGQMKVSISESNINEQMEYIHTFFKPEVEGKGMQLFLKNTLSQDKSIINTDKEKVYAILTNLVKNAIKFTHKGSIEFGYWKKGGFLEFYVKDTGSGISPEKIELIFERFRQGSEAITRNFEGAGLGLSISKAYVEMLGGKIWADSELEKGSTFYFTIPYDVPSDSGTVNTGALLNLPEIDIPENLKILIAEDDKISEQLITKIAKQIGCEVLIARNGIEAVEICRKNSDIDLVLMDIKMPQMDGHEATRQIRLFNQKVVIIAQTAYGLHSDREKAIKAGCNDYISKPISKAALYMVLQNHFGRNGGSIPDA